MDEHTFEQKRKRHRPFVGVKNSMGLPLIKIEYHCSLKKKENRTSLLIYNIETFNEQIGHII